MTFAKWWPVGLAAIVLVVMGILIKRRQETRAATEAFNPTPTEPPGIRTIDSSGVPYYQIPISGWGVVGYYPGDGKLITRAAQESTFTVHGYFATFAEAWAWFRTRFGFADSQFPSYVFDYLAAPGVV